MRQWGGCHVTSKPLAVTRAKRFPATGSRASRRRPLSARVRTHCCTARRARRLPSARAHDRNDTRARAGGGGQRVGRPAGGSRPTTQLWEARNKGHVPFALASPTPPPPRAAASTRAVVATLRGWGGTGARGGRGGGGSGCAGRQQHSMAQWWRARAAAARPPRHTNARAQCSPSQRCRAWWLVLGGSVCNEEGRCAENIAGSEGCETKETCFLWSLGDTRPTKKLHAS